MTTENKVARRKLSLQHLALRWLLDQSAVTSAIVGARTVAQLDDSLAGAPGPRARPGDLGTHR